MSIKLPKPTCVISGDIHFTLATLELATEVVKQMLAKATKLGVPVVLNGDTLDSKAIIRGEIANRLIELLSNAQVPIIINTGNHDCLNSKAKEHSLNFLRPYARVIDSSTFIADLNATVIPYQDSGEELEAILKGIPKGSTLIVHQGLQTAYLGHYTQDKTSLPPSTFDGYRVIASHYHRRQDIKCGETGLFSYVGNPYSLSYGEANDPEKGFQVLYDDGSLEFIPTNLRKHVVKEYHTDDFLLNETLSIPNVPVAAPEDLLWVKVRGPKSILAGILKQALGERIVGHSNFKLDLIPTDSDPTAPAKIETLTDGEILDALIDSTSETDSEKASLKVLWRDLVE